MNRQRLIKFAVCFVGGALLALLVIGVLSGNAVAWIAVGFVPPFAIYAVALYYTHRSARRRAYKDALESSQGIAAIEGLDDGLWVLTARRDGARVLVGQVYGNPDTPLVVPISWPIEPSAEVQSGMVDATQKMMSDCDDVRWVHYNAAVPDRTGMYL